MPQFDVSFFLSQFFWLTIVFAFLYMLISKFVAPKAESIFTTRNQYLEENIRHADEYNKKIQHIKSTQTKNLAELDASIKNARKEKVNLLEKSFNSKKLDLANNIAMQIKNTQHDIDKYVAEFKEEQSESSIKLAAFLIQKITQKPANLQLLKKISRDNK